MSKKLKSYRLDDHTLQVLAECKEGLNLSTDVEVIRKAIRLLSMAINNQTEGGALKITSGDKVVREIIL